MATNSYISYYNIRALADKDAVLNTYFTDIIGNKEDTASNASNTASIVALLRYIIANLSSDTDIESLIGKLDTLAHTGAVDNSTTLMGYIKQLITDEIALSTIIGIPTGADLSSDISAIKTVVDNIYSVTDTEIAAIKTIVDALPDNGSLTSIAQENTLTSLIGTPVSTVSDDIAFMQLQVTDTLNLTSCTEYVGVATYNDSGAEQEIFEYSSSNKKRLINSIWLDISGFTKNGTIKLYHKIAGVYKLINSINLTAGSVEGIDILSKPISIIGDIKVTYTEALDEETDVSVPYYMILEVKEV